MAGEGLLMVNNCYWWFILVVGNEPSVWVTGKWVITGCWLGGSHSERGASAPMYPFHDDQHIYYRYIFLWLLRNTIDIHIITDDGAVFIETCYFHHHLNCQLLVISCFAFAVWTIKYCIWYHIFMYIQWPILAQCAVVHFSLDVYSTIIVLRWTQLLW